MTEPTPAVAAPAAPSAATAPPSPAVEPSIKAAASTAEAAIKSDAVSLLAKAKPYLYALGAAVAGFVIGHFVK